MPCEVTRKSPVKPRNSMSHPAGPWLFLVFLFLVNVSGSALPLTVGPYKVEVEVRTTLYNLIPHAIVKGSSSGNLIRISAYAPGYVSREGKVTIRPGVYSYQTVLVLKDVEKRFDVLDYQHKPIVSAYLEKDQTGTPTDQYAISAFIPRKGWPHPSPSNVMVNQPGYGFPVQNSTEITIRDDFYRVRMLMDRAVLDDPNKFLLVYVNTSEIINPIATRQWIGILRLTEKRDPPAAGDLSRRLVGLWPEDAIPEPVPESLSRLKAQMNRFEALHSAPQPSR